MSQRPSNLALSQTQPSRSRHRAAVVVCPRGRWLGHLRRSRSSLEPQLPWSGDCHASDLPGRPAIPGRNSLNANVCGLQGSKQTNPLFGQLHCCPGPVFSSRSSAGHLLSAFALVRLRPLRATHHLLCFAKIASFRRALVAPRVAMSLSPSQVTPLSALSLTIPLPSLSLTKGPLS